MRCTRCDQIAFHEILGRTPSGRLVFGWCEACLREERCELVDAPGVPLHVRPTRSVRSRWRRVIRSVRKLRGAGRRALGLMLIAALMALWGGVLTAVGGIRLWGTGSVSKPGDSTAPPLLVGGALLAFCSLGIWGAAVTRTRRVQLGLRVTQVAAIVAACFILLWALVHEQAGRNPLILGLAVLALAISFGASRMARRWPNPNRAGRSLV
jgi:hypothetical protein